MKCRFYWKIYTIYSVLIKINTQYIVHKNKKESKRVRNSNKAIIFFVFQ